MEFFFFFCLCSEECKKDVPIVFIDMHSCSLEAKIKLNLGAFLLLTYLFMIQNFQEK